MLDDRSGLKYPPFSWIAKIEFIGSNSKTLFSLSTKIKNNLFNPLHRFRDIRPCCMF